MLAALPISIPAPEKGAELFQTYGPFFICVLLLAIAYAFAFLLYKKIDKSRNAHINEAFLKDFRLFYKMSIYGTLVSAIIGMSWWVTANVLDLSKLRTDNDVFRKDVARLKDDNQQLRSELDSLKKSRYFVYNGIISTGVEENETLDASLASGPDRPYMFMAFRDPVQKILKFQVSSIEPLSKIGPIHILLWRLDQAKQKYDPSFLTVRFKMTGTDEFYKFNKLTPESASIEPAMVNTQPR